MKILTVALSLLACATALMGAGCDGLTRKKKTNVILIVIDTLRADHLSHYGYEQPTAPALDAFRSQSTLFNQCYSPAPWTGPSVASLHTGLFTARHRTNAHGEKLNQEATTLAESLLNHGWHTKAISFNVEVSRKTGFNQGFEDFDDYLGKVLSYPDIGEMVPRLQIWLEQIAREPFFLYLQPMNVHGPYRVPKERRGTLLGRPPDGQFVYNDTLMAGIITKNQLSLRDNVNESYLQSLIE